ncbi:MAG: hypothetical protein U0Q12_03080 [Vicinamibacterales bacterium]
MTATWRRIVPLALLAVLVAPGLSRADEPEQRTKTPVVDAEVSHRG